MQLWLLHTLLLLSVKEEVIEVIQPVNTAAAG